MTVLEWLSSVLDNVVAGMVIGLLAGVLLVLLGLLHSPRIRGWLLPCRDIPSDPPPAAGPVPPPPTTILSAIEAILDDGIGAAATALLNRDATRYRAQRLAIAKRIAAVSVIRGGAATLAKAPLPVKAQPAAPVGATAEYEPPEPELEPEPAEPEPEPAPAPPVAAPLPPPSPYRRTNFKQRYTYTVKGKPEPFGTLREALVAAGVAQNVISASAWQHLDYARLPKKIRVKITRKEYIDGSAES